MQTQTMTQDRAAVEIKSATFWKDVTLVVSASLFMALCARISLPLFFSPVPLSLQNFGVLVIALLLGPWRGMAALALYLLEGASGLPIFAPGGPGGIAQLFGPTGGFLLSYPLVAWLAGEMFKRLGKSAKAAIFACAGGEALLFICGYTWFLAFMRLSPVTAFMLSVAPFLPGEILKIASATAISTSWQRFRSRE